MSARAKKRILELAKEIAEQEEAGAAEIQEELREIEAQKAEKEAELNAAKLAFKRSFDFQVRIGSDYQCPRCWIIYHRRGTLRSLAGTASIDRYECQVCGFLIED
jgi:hypothetical protein